jgi:apolipoprotein N-acyltransferase
VIAVLLEARVYLEQNRYHDYNTVIVLGGNAPYNYFSGNRYQKNHLEARVYDAGHQSTAARA